MIQPLDRTRYFVADTAIAYMYPPCLVSQLRCAKLSTIVVEDGERIRER